VQQQPNPMPLTSDEHPSENKITTHDRTKPTNQKPMKPTNQRIVL
jgi:hypothetical protein